MKTENAYGDMNAKGQWMGRKEDRKRKLSVICEEGDDGRERSRDGDYDVEMGGVERWTGSCEEQGRGRAHRVQTSEQAPLSEWTHRGGNGFRR